MSTNLGGSFDYVFTLELLVDIEAMKYSNWMKNICGLNSWSLNAKETCTWFYNTKRNQFGKCFGKRGLNERSF
jgi:hypothetical protein